jgi:hypothetical protein
MLLKCVAYIHHVCYSRIPCMMDICIWLEQIYCIYVSHMYIICVQSLARLNSNMLLKCVAYIYHVCSSRIPCIMDICIWLEQIYCIYVSHMYIICVQSLARLNSNMLLKCVAYIYHVCSSRIPCIMDICIRRVEV